VDLQTRTRLAGLSIFYRDSHRDPTILYRVLYRKQLTIGVSEHVGHRTFLAMAWWRERIKQLSVPFELPPYK
jgi:hypothetical protein